MPGRRNKPKRRKPPKHQAPGAQVVVGAPVVQEEETRVGPPLREMIVQDFCDMDKASKAGVVRAALRNILRQFGKK